MSSSCLICGDEKHEGPCAAPRVPVPEPSRFPKVEYCGCGEFHDAALCEGTSPPSLLSSRADRLTNAIVSIYACYGIEPSAPVRETIKELCGVFIHDEDDRNEG